MINWLKVRRLNAIIRGKEKKNAREKIKSQRIHMTHAMAGEKLIRQFPRTNEKEADRCEKLRIPIQELVEKIGDDMPERSAVIDCRLPAFRAPMHVQLR